MADEGRFLLYILSIQIFYSISITMLVYALGGMSANSLVVGQYSGAASDITTIAGKIQATTQSQIRIPIIDLGALVFYSGNIILDLLLNFAFALPLMVNILVDSFLYFFAVDAYLASFLKIFIFVIASIIYFINLLMFVLNVRARGSVV